MARKIDCARSVASDDEQERLLALLEAQSRRMMGLDAEPSLKRPRIEEDTDENEASLDEDEASLDEDALEDDEEGWTGLAEAEDESTPAPALARPAPAVVHFSDSTSRGRDPRDAPSAAVSLKSLMSSSVAKQRHRPDDLPRKRSKSEKAEDANESEMRRLDASLAEIIKAIPNSADHYSSLAPARKPSAPIQRNTPMTLRRDLNHARLARAKKDAEADRLAGAVRARPSKAAAGDGPALTKSAMRIQNGDEAKRKRNAKGLGGGGIGKALKGGNSVHFSKKEIARINAGTVSGPSFGKKRR